MVVFVAQRLFIGARPALAVRTGDRRLLKHCLGRAFDAAAATSGDDGPQA
jgi:hypothetical protein